MTQRKRPAPPDRPSPNATSTAKDTASEPDLDFDKRVVSQVDWSIWQAVSTGHFRLAVKCDVCGRWLTSKASKQAHRGPRCAKAVVAE